MRDNDPNIIRLLACTLCFIYVQVLSHSHTLAKIGPSYEPLFLSGFIFKDNITEPFKPLGNSHLELHVFAAGMSSSGRAM